MLYSFDEPAEPHIREEGLIPRYNTISKLFALFCRQKGKLAEIHLLTISDIDKSLNSKALSNMPMCSEIFNMHSRDKMNSKTYFYSN